MRDAAARADASVPAVMLAAAAALVHRLTAQEEVVYASPPDGGAATLSVRRGVRLDELVAQTRGAAAAFALDERVHARLELEVADTRGNLVLTATRRAARPGEHSAALMLDQLTTLLRRSLEEPHVEIGAPSLVTASTRDRLPDPRAPLAAPHYPPVSSETAAIARRAPAAVAVAMAGASWTYGELWASALAAAAALAAEGVAAESVVAVTGRPSFELVAAILGTLEAGAVLLPIDSAGPARRQELLCAQAGASHLVTATPEGLVVDALPHARPLAPPPHAPPAAGAPAYLVYTSGTTGAPQAVLGHHGGLGHFVAWQRETWGIGPGDRVAHLTSLSFDVVLRELFVALTSGATLCLPDGWPLEPRAALRWLQEDGVTVVHAVPTLARAWLDAAPADVFLSELRLTFFAGEPLTDALVDSWRARTARSASLVNLYGPTETTLAKCSYAVPDPPEPGIQPIGRPLPAAQALVLSPAGELCGVGEPGEIVLRTPFRSFGYRDAPELQRRRFRRNPFTHDADDLVYATGDIGRYRADGSLDIFGRIDEQVKIRGVRVEPREVAAVLQRHPRVHDAAVVARPGPELVAYVVSAEGATDLRSFLLDRFPSAAVPASFVSVACLPYASNEKLDVAALPDPPPTARERSLAEPRDYVEQQILGIWNEVLSRQVVGCDDVFFVSGG